MNPTTTCVFVTGAASGIGRALVTRLCAQGFRVLATDFAQDLLQTTAQAEGWSQDAVLTAHLDVRSADAWEAALHAATSRFGRVDILCNVAGYLRPGHIQDTTPADIDKHIDTNLKGTILGVQVVSRHMLAQGGGQIVNIASLAGIAPVPGLTLYSASKFGVRGFSLAADGDLRPHGVAVTAICPDAVETPMLALQEDEPAAALTFSGPKALSTADVCDAIFEAFRTKPAEVVLPKGRGILAKFASLLPGVARKIEPLLRSKGRKQQANRTKSSRPSTSSADPKR